MRDKMAASKRPPLRRAGSRSPASGTLNLAERLLTVREVAGLLHVSRPTVLAMIRRGELPAIRLPRAWRIPQRALKGYLHLRSTWVGDKPAPNPRPRVD